LSRRVCVYGRSAKTISPIEIGFALGSAHWGNGYAVEAVSRVCQFVEKAGFQREGVLRERYIYNGEIQDVVYYGLLAREFTGQTIS